jgi:hypothetical protein
MVPVSLRWPSAFHYEVVRHGSKGKKFQPEKT